MASIIVVMLSLIINIVMFYLMYQGVYIPSGKTPFFIALIMFSVYALVGYFFGETRTKQLNRLFTVSLTLNIAYSLSSLVYHHWKLDSIISSFSMMKISLVVLVIVILYLNLVYIRAEISYKRKRGNQRIRKEPQKSLLEKWREKRRKENSNEIEIVLGHSTESEERVPPV